MASGTEGSVEDEFETAMRDIHKKMEVKEEKEKAVEIRKIATERIGQTKKRHGVHHESDDDGEFSETEETPRKKKKVDLPNFFLIV